MRNLDIAPHPEDPPEIIEKVLIRAKGLEISEGNFGVFNFSKYNDFFSNFCPTLSQVVN